MINEIIIGQLEKLMQEKDHVVIAIDGPDHATSSNLAQELQQKYKCNIFRTSNYTRLPDDLTPETLAQPGGRLDWQRLKAEVIEPLKEGRQVIFRVYSVIAMSYMPPMPVDAKKLNIIEGVYSMHPELAGLYDLTLFAPANSVSYANEAEALYYNSACPTADIVV